MNRKMIKTIVLAALMAVPFFAKAQTFAGITTEQNAQNTPAGWTADKDYGIDKAQLQRLRKNMVVKTVILNRLCSILDCKIEDIMEFVPDEDIK